MNFEHIRHELEALNEERWRLLRSDVNASAPHTGESDRENAITWEDHHKKVEEVEERLFDFEFGLMWYVRHVGDNVISSSYVLIPKNEGWIKARREARGR